MVERNPIGKHFGCPAEITADLIGGRWKIVLLWYLFQGVQRFSDLQRAIPGITQKVLTHQLRDMEKSGLLKRTVYAEVPPKVEYQITPLGLTLKPVVDAMHHWGAEHASKQ
ncbi:MAG TPA: helix-turn-helix domain-containing protein [Nitrospira sp.]|nr:helix-turn-helix domain-containing protein [Nitrospira sp.]